MASCTASCSYVGVSATKFSPRITARPACVRGNVRRRVPPSRGVPARALRPNETAEEALQRRRRESQRVEERVRYITSIEELDEALSKAGDGLVALEVLSEQVCETGFDEAELHWKDDKAAALVPCQDLKHTFARTARDCPDVQFLAVEVDDSDGAQPLLDRLGVSVLPTLQFWRSGQMLWEHRGVSQMDQDLGEGVLYFGDTAANNEKASKFIKDLSTHADLDAFVASSPGEKILKVVDVSLTGAAPCVHIFPAVLALARNFTGTAQFARLLGDASDDSKLIMGELDIKEVPTFIFYKDGQEVGRHVGSSRGDLIGQILAQLSAAGIALPQPTGRRQAPAPPPRKTSSASRWR